MDKKCVLVTGGVRNGKSNFGESLFTDIVASRLCYIATMYRNPSDDETTARIEKHRIQRAGRGFDTLERMTDLSGLPLAGYDGALLECLPNLLANEMFMTENGADNAAAAIMAGLDALLESVPKVVVITNDVFSDGMEYAKETMQYMDILARLNNHLASKADEVYELVCGIPLRLK